MWKKLLYFTVYIAYVEEINYDYDYDLSHIFKVPALQNSHWFASIWIRSYTEINTLPVRWSRPVKNREDQ